MSMVLFHMAVISQLFFQTRHGSVVLVVIKIVDDLLLTEEKDFAEAFSLQFDSTFKFGTVVRGPGRLKFYGISIVQFDDFYSNNTDDKLFAINAFTISCAWRRQCDPPLTSAEKLSFMFVNSANGWLGIPAPPFCAFSSSHSQQMIQASLRRPSGRK